MSAHMSTRMSALIVVREKEFVFGVFSCCLVFCLHLIVFVLEILGFVKVSLFFRSKIAIAP